jgi:hypothetical protein
MSERPKPPSTDAMACRSCGREERASEGYPCARCGTFICIICMMQGVTLCRECATKPDSSVPA